MTDKKIDIIFDRAPGGHHGPRFIEVGVEDKSVSLGKWFERAKGQWSLSFGVDDVIRCLGEPTEEGPTGPVGPGPCPTGESSGRLKEEEEAWVRLASRLENERDRAIRETKAAEKKLLEAKGEIAELKERVRELEDECDKLAIADYRDLQTENASLKERCRELEERRAKCPTKNHDCDHDTPTHNDCVECYSEWIDNELQTENAELKADKSRLFNDKIVLEGANIDLRQALSNCDEQVRKLKRERDGLKKEKDFFAYKASENIEAKHKAEKERDELKRERDELRSRVEEQREVEKINEVALDRIYLLDLEQSCNEEKIQAIEERLFSLEQKG